MSVTYMLASKARLFAVGHRQHEGVDYVETYVPVSRHAAMRILLGAAVVRSMDNTHT